MRRHVLGLVAATAIVVAGCGSSDDDTPAAQNSGAGDQKVSITVGCQPPKSSQGVRPGTTTSPRSSGCTRTSRSRARTRSPARTPKTFRPSWPAARMENVFYVYFTDVQKIIADGQAADITTYLGSVKD